MANYPRGFDFTDIVGATFGRWRVLEHVGHLTYRCQCACGTIAEMKRRKLKRGDSNSCGCLKDDVHSARLRTHGLTGTSEHRSWSGMIQRCTNPLNNRYANYGARGITVCARWSSFANFLADMGPAPAGTSIDRIDNDGPYSPENCRWSTRRDQMRNRTDNRRITHAGRTLCLTEWAESAGLSVGTLWSRLKSGWAFEDAISQEKRAW
jgi:hypothetical protein